MRRLAKLVHFVLRLCLLIVALVSVAYLAHRPFRPAAPAVEFKLISHRGVHQTFHRENLTNETCTAERIDPPRHGFIENTLPSLRAAFAAGADLIEIDVHRTSDGELVVFHDWTLDCRTDGKGETRQHSLAQIKALDAGYGYTADGGKSFPFRGKFVGAIPSFRELLLAFPDAHFMIDQKDRSAETTALIAAQMQDFPGAVERVCLNSDASRNAQFVAALGGQVCVFANKDSIKRCLVDYLRSSGFGDWPKSCRDQNLIVADNGSMRVLWGWPGTFIERAHAGGARVFVWTDDAARAQALRDTGFDGVFTDRIEDWAASSADPP